jgi:phosphoribosylamine--glycine ligase
VLNFVSVSNEYEDSRRKALKMINKLNWSNGYYRKDIGYKIIDQ